MKDRGPAGLFPEVIDLAEVDSTNRYALDEGRPGLLVRAMVQTAGRGRRGRQWHSPEGENLTMTATLTPPDQRYPIIAGTAVRSALAALAPSTAVSLKWPNDVVIDGRKVCGILCESRADITAIGMGVNVNQTVWPGDLEHRAASLRQLTGRRFDLDEVAMAVAAELSGWIRTYREHGFEPVRQEFLRHGSLQDYAVLDDQGRRCSIVDLTPDGYLIIEVAGDRRVLVSESISIGWEAA
ncbi:MAG TPA: biotin--[acetyl-CoA-carboxylase] ligase [Deltaproteobacteria bacterium]|nr:biotin--[acetyl-CoA-carboxylase] ligase [Deltaproteobacteria bacterium]